MRNLIEFINIDGSRLSLDGDNISGVIEMKNVFAKDENNNVTKVPDHVQLIMNGLQFRVKGTYDEIMTYIKEEDFNNNLGIN